MIWLDRSIILHYFSEFWVEIQYEIVEFLKKIEVYPVRLRLLLDQEDQIQIYLKEWCRGDL
jgi:hypothetical protein